MIPPAANPAQDNKVAISGFVERNFGKWGGVAGAAKLAEMAGLRADDVSLLETITTARKNSWGEDVYILVWGVRTHLMKQKIICLFQAKYVLSSNFSVDYNRSAYSFSAIPHEVVLSGLDPSITLLGIWDAFSTFGELLYVDSKAKGQGTISVRFVDNGSLQPFIDGEVADSLKNLWDPSILRLSAFDPSLTRDGLESKFSQHVKGKGWVVVERVVKLGFEGYFGARFREGEAREVESALPGIFRRVPVFLGDGPVKFNIVDNPTSAWARQPRWVSGAGLVIGQPDEEEKPKVEEKPAVAKLEGPAARSIDQRRVAHPGNEMEMEAEEEMMGFVAKEEIKPKDEGMDGSGEAEIKEEAEERKPKSEAMKQLAGREAKEEVDRDGEDKPKVEEVEEMGNTVKDEVDADGDVKMEAASPSPGEKPVGLPKVEPEDDGDLAAAGIKAEEAPVEAANPAAGPSNFNTSNHQRRGPDGRFRAATPTNGAPRHHPYGRPPAPSAPGSSGNPRGNRG